MKSEVGLASSFRDPSGFLFRQGGILYRQVNQKYAANYDQLMSSGLYEQLVQDHLLVPHQEVKLAPPLPDEAYILIEPELVPFVSYPYEWAYSQLKDAALATLAIEKRALDHGMSLKDASAYNIQFRGSNAVLIDTLSFERYQAGKPWVAYRQFCQHFLAPLALMSYCDIRLGQLLRVYIDGVPLDLASRLLPAKTRLKFSLLSHIHMHAKSQQRYSDKAIDTASLRPISEFNFRALIDSLETAVKSLKWSPGDTEWAEYYSITNYGQIAFEHKKAVVGRFLDKCAPRTVWDLGGNTGVFSQIASDKGIETVSFDLDPSAIEASYRRARAQGIYCFLPLILDLTNPSPGLGWAHKERQSLIDRGPVDAVMGLALIHHLAISNNVPLDMVADFMARLGRYLIIEFIPKTDSQVKKLLSTREDIFCHYTQQGFETAFASRYDIIETAPIKESARTLYLMERKHA